MRTISSATIHLSWRQVIVITAALVWLGAYQFPALAAEKAETGYELEQKSILVGNVTMRIFPRAVQVFDKGRGIYYSSHAPDWKLQIINPAEKTYFEGNIDNFSGMMTQGVTLFTGRMLTDATYAPPAKQPDGLILYTTSPEFTKRAFENKKNVTNSNGNPKTIDVWINPSMPAPPRAVAMLGRLFGIACPPGVPVRVRYFDFDHEEKVYLKTLKFTQKQFTDADFEKRLSSYKRVATSSAACRSRQQDDAVSDMLGGLDDGIETRKKH
jgi:hypothetical protein